MKTKAKWVCVTHICETCGDKKELLVDPNSPEISEVWTLCEKCEKIRLFKA